VRGSRVVVLGAAYKRNVDDVRESPALDIISLLQHRGADVVYHDPHVQRVRLEDSAVMESSLYSDKLLEDADCVVIVTDHDWYDWKHVVEHSKLLVDSRHVTHRFGGGARIVTL
jgi:UDP-N-acetyl-D-glucosamine dehydrogenase